MTWQILIQIFAALGGIAGISSLVNLLISRKKTVAETVDVGQNTNDKMLKNLQEDNKTLRDERDAARKERGDVRIQNEQLFDQIEELEWDGMEQRRLLISLVNWCREAWAYFEEKKIAFRQPPSFDMMSKRPKNRPTNSESTE